MSESATPQPAPQSAPSSPAPSPTARKKRNWRRILIISGICVLALFVIGRVIISVAFPAVLKKVAAAYDLDARYERMELYLLGGDVGLTHLTFTPKTGGDPVLDMEYCRADVSALNLLRGRLVVRRVEADGVSLRVDRGPDGSVPLVQNLLAGRKIEADRPTDISLDPPLRVDMLRLSRIRAKWRDQSVTPAVETVMDMTMRLSDLGSPVRPTRFYLDITSQPLLDTLRVEGEGTSRNQAMDATFSVLVRGLHPKPAAGYLMPLGIKPVADDISLQCVAKIKTRAAGPATTTRPADIAGDITLEGITVRADGREAAGVDRVLIKADKVSGQAGHFASTLIDGVRAAAERTAEGNVRVAGLELVPVPASSTPTTSPAPMATTRPRSTWAVERSLADLTIRNVRATFTDASVSPPADLAFIVNKLNVTNLRGDATCQITGDFTAPRLAKTIALTGTAKPFSAVRTLDAKLVAQGIHPEAIRGHLDALGVESTLADGTLTGELHAAVRATPAGAVEASARLANVTLTDGPAGELAAFDTVEVSRISLDPNASRIRIEAIDFVGPRLAARRGADGAIAAVGLRTKRAAATKPAAPAAPPAPAVAAARPISSSQPPSSMPTFELGRLTWKGVDVQLVDDAVAPATNVCIKNAGVELTNIVVNLDRRATTAPTSGKLHAWISADGVADSLDVEGTITPAAGAITADLNITGKGLRGDLLAAYLKEARIEPALKDGSLQLRTRVSLAQKDDHAIAASLAIESLRYADGEQELVGLDRLAIDDVALTSDGVAVASLQIDKPRARAQRNSDGSFAVAGFRVNVPSTQPVAEAVENPPTPAVAATPASSQPSAAPFVATLGKLRVNDGSIAWADKAVSPAVDAIGRANVEIDNFVFGRDAKPAALKIIAKLDKTLEQFTAVGAVSASTTSPMLKLDLSGNGLREGVFASYLPPGTNVTLKDGRFKATLEAAMAPQPQGGESAKLIISAVDFRDGQSAQPLFAFDSARVLVSRADIPGKIVAIDEISLSGLQTGARQAPDGSIHALGLKFATTAPSQAQATAAAPAANAALSTQPAGTSDVNVLIAAGREKLPLITLKTLAINLRNISFVDESQPGATPVALADVLLRNKSPIELLGPDPQSRPPVDIEVVGKVDPLVGKFTIATQIPPFAAQPTLAVTVNASGIDGAGLTAVMPQLREQIDGTALTDGRFAASLEAGAKVAKRGPAHLDFSKPMEVVATVRDVAYRGDGAENSPVLAGVQEVRADGVCIDPATGSVIARSVEISRPIARAWRDADGIHALGLIIKTPATQPIPQTSTQPTEPTPAPSNGAFVASYKDPASAKAPAPAKPTAEMTIEKLTVSGIDVHVEDRSVQPTLIVALNSLEAEIRGLSNMALHEPRPIRFNVTAGAAKVPLADNKPPREMFTEIAASGNVTLCPSLRGWARSSVNGLEMLSLRGPAAASKVEIGGGIFDSNVDVRFTDDGALDTRSRFAFTDLRMSEPDDGLIRRTLKLPAPLDTMIIVLQDTSGAITVPLKVTVKESEVGGGQLAGAAVTALSSILATAMASAPLKVTGGVTSLVGVDKALPMLGSKKKAKGPQDAGAVDFYAGAGEASSDEVTLQQLIDRMRRDRKLQVTLRHELGGGDIARASQRANPTADEAESLGAYLRQRKTSLLQQRDQLAPSVRAMIVASPAASSDSIEQLREVEAQLATTEDALDRVYDLTRPGAQRQAERRTRAASLEIAEARLTAMKEAIVTAGIPDAENRVRVIKPQFAPAEGDAGGRVTMVVTSKKKP